MRNLIVVICFVTQIAFGASPQAGRGAPTGKVVQLVGAAKAADRALNYGDMVYAGEVIRTDIGGRVKILMTDRSIIDVGEDSAIRIRNYPANLATDQARELDLEMGSMRASVKKSPSGKGKFFIRTKSSVLAVRGTELLVGVRNGLKVDLFEGTVQVDKTLLLAGQQLNMGPGGTPEVRNLSLKERETIRNGSVTEVGTSEMVAQAISKDTGENRHTASIERFDTRLFIPRTNKYGEFGYNTGAVQSPFVPVLLVVRFQVNR